MRVFKKIMYIILALVPILPLLLFAFCNVGNTNGVEFTPFGRFGLLPTYEDEDGYKVTIAFVEKDTISDFVFDALIQPNGYVHTYEEIIESDPDSSIFSGVYRFYVYRYTGEVRFIERFSGFYAWFDSVGITPPAYLIFAIAYLAYMFFIHICFMIFDLIVFVPRKISEMLEV